MVTTVPVPPFLANALQINRVAKYMLDLNWAPVVGAAIIRRDIWEKIAPPLRAQLQTIATAVGEKIRMQSRVEDDDAVVAMKKNGLVVQPVTPAIRDAWQALAEQAYPMIRGRIVPAEIFDQVRRVLVEFRAAHPGGAP